MLNVVNGYFEKMLLDFCIGNDNNYKKGELLSFKYEEIEKGDIDLYDEEDINDFYYVRDYIKNNNNEVNYKEYKFKVIEGDIECSWLNK